MTCGLTVGAPRAIAWPPASRGRRSCSAGASLSIIERARKSGALAPHPLADQPCRPECTVRRTGWSCRVTLVVHHRDPCSFACSLFPPRLQLPANAPAGAQYHDPRPPPSAPCSGPGSASTPTHGCPAQARAEHHAPALSCVSMVREVFNGPGAQNHSLRRKNHGCGSASAEFAAKRKPTAVQFHNFLG